MAKTKKSLDFQRLLLNNHISVYQTTRKIPISTQSVKNVLCFLLHVFELQKMGIDAHFVGKKKISLLHQEFFNDPSPTDCLTLSYDRPSPSCHFLGEIFICPQAAAEFIKETSQQQLYKEITIYVIHCFLHLLGFEDTSETKQKKMQREEKKMIQILEKNALSITPY